MKFGLNKWRWFHSTHLPRWYWNTCALFYSIPNHHASYQSSLATFHQSPTSLGGKQLFMKICSNKAVPFVHWRITQFVLFASWHFLKPCLFPTCVWHICILLLFQTLFWIFKRSTSKLEYTLLRETHSWTSGCDKAGNLWRRRRGQGVCQKVSHNRSNNNYNDNKTTATTKQCKHGTFGCVFHLAFFVERGICWIKHMTRCHAWMYENGDIQQSANSIHTLIFFCQMLYTINILICLQ